MIETLGMKTKHAKVKEEKTKGTKMLKNRSSLALEREKERWFIKDTSRTFIFFFFFFFCIQLLFLQK